MCVAPEEVYCIVCEFVWVCVDEVGFECVLSDILPQYVSHVPSCFVWECLWSDCGTNPLCCFLWGGVGEASVLSMHMIIEVYGLCVLEGMPRCGKFDVVVGDWCLVDVSKALV